MSRATVRTAVQEFFTNPPLEGVTNLYRAMPIQVAVDPQGFQPASTFGVIWIVSETERRMSTPAVTGWRMVDYMVHLQICHAYDGEGEEAMDSVDALSEQIKARLRSNPQLGQQSNVIFEAAQGAEPHITGWYGEPTVLGDSGFMTWFGIEFRVSEAITA